MDKRMVDRRKGGVLRTIDRSAHTVFLRLPDGSFFSNRDMSAIGEVIVRAALGLAQNSPRETLYG
jgi:hypothetical protein